MIFCARAMCGRGKPSLGLMARLGKSIAKQSEGRAGEKVARSGRPVQIQDFPFPLVYRSKGEYLSAG